MVRNVLAKAAENIGQLVTGKKSKVTQRKILIVFLDTELGLCVLGAKKNGDDDAARFRIQKGERAIAAAIKLLRDALPFFDGMNIVATRCNRPSFINGHIEYDVVHIGFCDMLGIPADTTAQSCLKEEGFTIVPLTEHPLRKQLQEVVGKH